MRSGILRRDKMKEKALTIILNMILLGIAVVLVLDPILLMLLVPKTFRIEICIGGFWLILSLLSAIQKK
jgi:hypothetical protein